MSLEDFTNKDIAGIMIALLPVFTIAGMLIKEYLQNNVLTSKEKTNN